MAGRVFGQKSVRPGRQDQDVIRDGVTFGGDDDFVFRLDFRDEGVEMIAEGAARAAFVVFVPGLGIEVERLDLSVLEEARETDSIVCEMRFLADDHHIIFLALCIELH